MKQLKKTKKSASNPVYNTVLNKVLLGIISLGVLIIVASLVTVIFFRSWTDAQFNPEDGAAGWFILYGMVLIFFGGLPLLSSIFLAWRGVKLSHDWGLLKFVVLTIALLIALFSLLSLWSEHDGNNFEDNTDQWSGESLELDTSNQPDYPAP